MCMSEADPHIQLSVVMAAQQASTVLSNSTCTVCNQIELRCSAQFNEWAGWLAMRVPEMFHFILNISHMDLAAQLNIESNEL